MAGAADSVIGTGLMWTPPPPPSNERQRLSDLQGYDILDTAGEERFDRITRLAARIYNADVSFLSFIDAGQQWMKSKTSDALHDYVARDSSVCTLVVSSGEARVFEDLRSAPELVGHPLATEMPWRFYASVPVMGGSDTVIGTLCIMRTEPGAPPGFTLEALNDLAAVTAHELELTLQHSRLSEASNRDSLTGLFNRRMLDEELRRAARRATRLAVPATILLIDLDHFKEVNDHLGHAAGDAILSDFARFLSAFARRPNDVVARIGGEEFALVLAETAAAGGEGVARSIIAGLNEAALPHPVRGRLTASIGVAEYVAGEGPFTWLDRADRALYRAKALGRATVNLA